MCTPYSSLYLRSSFPTNGLQSNIKFLGVKILKCPCESAQSTIMALLGVLVQSESLSRWNGALAWTSEIQVVLLQRSLNL